MLEKLCTGIFMYVKKKNDGENVFLKQQRRELTLEKIKDSPLVYIFL